MRNVLVETEDGKGNVIESRFVQMPAIVSPEEFLSRFHAAEQTAIAVSTHLQVVTVRHRLFARTDGLDLDSDDVVNALALFESLLLIAPGRADEIRGL